MNTPPTAAVGGRQDIFETDTNLVTQAKTRTNPSPSQSSHDERGQALDAADRKLQNYQFQNKHLRQQYREKNNNNDMQNLKPIEKS